ncbi:MAG: preprotein translocase subunit YajC [Deltaproteobacteria bacterium]|nr:preprotein translocase subunit YajC [Deltaproteobacteria bacterium]
MQATGKKKAPPWYMQIWPFVLIIVIFYFLLIRPQQKKAKEHQSMLSSVQKGDYVMTTGGLFGRVTGMTEQVVTVEISDRVRVKVAKSYIAGKAKPESGKIPEAPRN